jgi:hypothetical protein
MAFTPVGIAFVRCETALVVAATVGVSARRVRCGIVDR